MTNPRKLNIVGPQLQLLRKWRRVSQRELSLKLCWLGWKVSRNGLAQMEITRKRITDCDLVFLAKALDVNITDFFPTTFSRKNLRSKIKSNRLMAWRPASPRPIRIARRRFDFKEKRRRDH